MRAAVDALSSIDPHRFDIDAMELTPRPRHTKKADVNSQILCCQCGMEFFCATWMQTVAAFRAHEVTCSRA